MSDDPTRTNPERTWLVCTFAVLTLLGVQLLSLMRAGTGLIGHDYVWFLPRLVEGLLFFKAQGLSIPHYSAFFCGGFPYHADPQVMFYSLPQLLTLWTDAWSAVEITAIIFLLLGGLFSYLLGRILLKLDPSISFLLAVAFAANGFFRSRFLIGHLTYHAFPLIPLILMGLFLERRSRLPSVLILAASFAYLVHSGGNYNAPIVGAAVVLSIPLLRLRCAVDYFEAALRGALGMTLAVALCASKLAAGLAFSGNHPRISRFNHADTFSEAANVIYSQLFAPGAFTPFPFGPWEYDSSISPLLPVGWLIAFWGVMRSGDRKAWAAMATFCVLLLAALQLATGNAAWVDALKELPIVKQMRVNIRFTGIVIFPLVVLAAIGFNSLKSRRAVAILVALSAFLPGEQQRPTAHTYMDLSEAKLSSLWEMADNGRLSVTGVTRAENDLDPLLSGMTNKRCYSVFFAKPRTRRLEEGGIWDVQDGAYNFVKPACYVYPEENRCKAGELISVSEKADLEALLAHRNPGWPLSSVQYAADSISLAAVIVFALLAAAAVWVQRLR